MIELGQQMTSGAAHSYITKSINRKDSSSWDPKINTDDYSFQGFFSPATIVKYDALFYSGLGFLLRNGNSVFCYNLNDSGWIIFDNANFHVFRLFLRQVSLSLSLSQTHEFYHSFFICILVSR